MTPDPTPGTALDATLRAQLGRTLDATPFHTVRGAAMVRYDGKVRDCFIDRAASASWSSRIGSARSTPWSERSRSRVRC